MNEKSVPDDVFPAERTFVKKGYDWRIQVGSLGQAKVVLSAVRERDFFPHTGCVVDLRRRVNIRTHEIEVCDTWYEPVGYDDRREKH